MNYRVITCALLSSVALSGCAFQRQTARMALDHNEFAAQTTNNQTVLNILRARDREALHFTSFGNIGGTVKLTAGGEASLTRNDDTNSRTFNADDVRTSRTRAASTVTGLLKATASVNTGTDFQLAVNATDEFYKGIMGPVTTPVIMHFLDQGWPPDLLSYLFIGRIDFYVGVRRSDVACKPIIEDAKAKNGKIPDECTKSGAEFRLLSVPGAADRAAESELFAEIIKCRRLAIANASTDPTIVRFNELDDIASISDTNLPKVVDKYRIEQDRYSIDLAKKSPTLTMAPSVNPLRAVREAEEKGIDPKRHLEDLNRESCDPTRIVLLDSFARLHTVAQVNPQEYKIFAEAVATGKINEHRNEAIRQRKVAEQALFRLDQTVPEPHPQGARVAATPLCGSIPDDEKEARRELRLAQLRAAGGELRNFRPTVEITGAEVPPATTGTSAPLGAAGTPFVLKNYFGDFAATGFEIDLKFVLSLRSVESIIYFLGEYIRFGTGPCVRGNGGVSVPIIAVLEGNPGVKEAFVEVRHRGKDYWVPVTGKVVSYPAGRSSQVINLVQQLLNLHRSAKDLPTVQTVRVAN